MKGSKNHKVQLPNKKAIKESIDTVEEFRLLCKHMLDTGLWATVDFPSKHHINNLLQLQYRKTALLINKYGYGLTNRALEMIPYCKAYLTFTRGERDSVEESDDKVENDRV